MELERAEGTSISWKGGKNPTVKVLSLLGGNVFKIFWIYASLLAGQSCMRILGMKGVPGFLD